MKCNKCSEDMHMRYIEYNTFGVCMNKNCSDYGKWPKGLEGLKKYLKECYERKSFCYSSDYGGGEQVMTFWEEYEKGNLGIDLDTGEITNLETGKTSQLVIKVKDRGK